MAGFTWFLTLGCAVGAAVAGKHHTRSTSSSFQIYGYGDSIGGLVLFSAGKSAYIGNPSLFNSSEAAPVIFTPTSSGQWLGSPNTTGLANSSAPAWSNLELAVPATTSSRHEVGLMNETAANSTTDMITDKFTTYGSFVGVTGTTGSLQTLWYGVATGTDGIYSLKWNDTEDANAVLLTLRTNPPSTS